ncbi:hypothetical protein KC852_03435 [Candidatus Nomurabacteria bacterium]|nr:hypothetical protein [Candidatus Nomurabacteria bacterium]
MLLKKYIYTNYPMDSWDNIRALFYVFYQAIQMFVDGVGRYNGVYEEFHIKVRTDWTTESMGHSGWGTVFFVEIDGVSTKVIVKKIRPKKVLEVIEEFNKLYSQFIDFSLN